MMLDRRGLLGGIGAGLLAAPAILKGQYRLTPFQLGVASGEPTADGFVLWTRLAPDPLEAHGGMPTSPAEVAWEVAEDARFTRKVAGGTALARPELAHSVHVEVAGLRPDTPYWYRFRAGIEPSQTGRAKTLPAPGTAPATVRFAVAGCQDYQQGLYTAYRHLAAAAHDFVFHYGDYIYEGRDAPYRIKRGGEPEPFRNVREAPGLECYSLDDYRRRYAVTKMDADLIAAHLAAPWFVTLDDHEVADNWAGLADRRGTPAELFALRRAAAFQAWYEHMPVRPSMLPMAGAMRIDRSVAVGKLLRLDLLDTRQFRTDQPCGDGFVPVCPERDRPDAQMLGRDGEARLDGWLRQRDTVWQGIGQQVMVMDLDRRTGDEPAPIANMDSWAGYRVPRRRLLQALGKRGDCVVLTGDEHQHFAGQLQLDGRDVAPEFVVTSISSGGDGADGGTGKERLLAGNSDLRFVADRRGFALCDVTADRWRTELTTVDQVSAPGGTAVVQGAFEVARGSPLIRAA